MISGIIQHANYMTSIPPEIIQKTIAFLMISGGIEVN